MNLLEAERTLYQDVWTSLEPYGEHAPGEHFLPLFLQIVGEQRGTILDAGTGSGKGAIALRDAGFHVYACDVTNAGMTDEARYGILYHDACLWHDLTPIAKNIGIWGRTKFDFVYCCDVLEHVPPQFTMLAINQMLRITRYGLFLSVSLVPDQFGVWVGTSLHRTVQPFVWWRDSLKELGTVEEARDLIHSGVFFVRPR